MNTELESVEDALTRAAKAIDNADVLALACHVTPDGDALGSVLALHHVLNAAGKTSIASFPKPFRVATHYRDVPGLELLVPPDEFPTRPELMVTFDCGSPDRLGGLRSAAEAADELIDVPVAKLSRTLFEEHRFGYIQLLAEALSSAELIREQSFVWTAVTQDMLNRHDVCLEEVEGLIDIVRRTAEADVACVLKEEGDGTVKVSLWSVGAADVRHVAAAHGGGGHRFAAGFTSDVGIAESVDRIRVAL